MTNFPPKQSKGQPFGMSTAIVSNVLVIYFCVQHIQESLSPTPLLSLERNNPTRKKRKPPSCFSFQPLLAHDCEWSSLFPFVCPCSNPASLLSASAHSSIEFSAHIDTCLPSRLSSTPRPGWSFKKSCVWTGKMTQQQVKLLVPKPGDLCVIPGIHKVETPTGCPLTPS